MLDTELARHASALLTGWSTLLFWLLLPRPTALGLFEQIRCKSFKLEVVERHLSLLYPT